MDTFTVVINLGALSTESDESIIDALEEITRYIRENGTEVADDGEIRDHRGNTVGTWGLA